MQKQKSQKQKQKRDKEKQLREEKNKLLDERKNLHSDKKVKSLLSQTEQKTIITLPQLKESLLKHDSANTRNFPAH